MPGLEHGKILHILSWTHYLLSWPVRTFCSASKSGIRSGTALGVRRRRGICRQIPPAFPREPLPRPCPWRELTQSRSGRPRSKRLFEARPGSAPAARSSPIKDLVHTVGKHHVHHVKLLAGLCPQEPAASTCRPRRPADTQPCDPGRPLQRQWRMERRGRSHRRCSGSSHAARR